jgi:hypothetical protein
MTDTITFPSEIRVRVNDIVAGTFFLEDDPADHRGVLSWHAQPRDGKLREAGSYGYLAETTLPAEAIAAAARAKEIVIRLEVDAALAGGLAIYGERFGRYPVDPTLVFQSHEVVGVAGFVVPGTRVDVLVTVRSEGTNNEPMTRTVVSRVEVLTAGTKFDQEKSRDGEPIPTSVVTLAVLPEDGERIALASNEGKITLALRNPLDVASTETRGVRLAALMRGTGPEPVVDPARNRVVARRPPPTPPPPAVYTVEAIRGAKRSSEVVR